MTPFLTSTSYLYGGNAPFIEDLYEQYLADPGSVASEWRNYFDKLVKSPGIVDKDVPHLPVEASFAAMARQSTAHRRSSAADAAKAQKQASVLLLIEAYRAIGIKHASLDPLKRMDQTGESALDPASYGLTGTDMATVFHTGSLAGPDRLPLSEIVARLRQTYSGNIGIEYTHITDRAQKCWLQERFEGDLSTPRFDTDKKQRILRLMTGAETLERYLHTRYVGQKRFSLEGGESLIPALDHFIQNSTGYGVQEIVIGMAHRGRLNVLINILGKLPRDLFAEFEGKQQISLPSGDVKYHMGFSSDIATPNGPVHVSLAFNPSHLEIVNPVVTGSVRARQQRRSGADVKRTAVPVLIHGDAAFGGLGVNQGTLNLSQTRGYGVGGTIHIVVNNQIGFTTSDLRDVRSTTYCTDIAKMVEAPIFHVNGDDPEAVCYAMQACADFRMTFGKDVVLDIVCYRKLGHNEGDDPLLTQPMMYKKVARHPGSRSIYAGKLMIEGLTEERQAEELIRTYRETLDRGEHVEQTVLSNYCHLYAYDWEKGRKAEWPDKVDTALSLADLKRLTGKVTTVPDGFRPHGTVAKVLLAREAMSNGEQPVDWGMAETLAYASLVSTGIGVRISGEDSGRGTFSHRHAVLHDQNRERWDQGTYVPLQHVAEDQANFLAIDSLLNEEAVLAYEYGYACSAPDQLVIWEAQFGDFANGAQVAIDQFISSGETKWGRLCGMVIMLPHGYDGQGPEHSSARLERWLQLCAENNMQIIMPSESAQIFHVLRRQMLRPFHRPLVIFMSKRLLRFKESMSPIEDFTEGEFRFTIGDRSIRNTGKVRRVVICSGQVYYDLEKSRKEAGLQNSVALVRLEQLYPFPLAQLAEEIARYPRAESFIWAQEEPQNQGAWYQVRHRLEEVLGENRKPSFAGRPSSASPAAGYMSMHNEQLRQLLADALGTAVPA